MKFRINLAMSVKKTAGILIGTVLNLLTSLKSIFIFLIIIFEFYVCFPWMYACVPSVCLVAMKVRRGHQSGNKDHCEPLYGFLESNLGLC